MLTILRLNHRKKRDKRITTHCALVARAFGADKFVYTGDEDKAFEKGVKAVVGQWGGNFSVKYKKNAKKFLKEQNKKTIVNLTMYGLPIQNEINKIRKNKGLTIIIGGAKVPMDFYRLSHYNISITSQPHSEVMALGLFLDRYFAGRELVKRFKNAKIRIIPHSCGKLVKKGL